MTQNQSSILVNNPHTKKAIAVLERYARAEAALKALEEESKAATELIKEAMIAGGVTKVVLDSETLQGYITLAERVTYSAEDISAVDPKYTKPTLDTAKVKAETVLTGNLPSGVTESRTQYITKKLKEVV